MSKKVYDYSYRSDPVYQTVLLPKHADQNFYVADVLWNRAETKEVRKDAQVAMHLVLALPDNEELNDLDRIVLAESFVQKHYIEKGLAAELVVHPPNRKVMVLEDNEVLGVEKGEKLEVVDKNEKGYVLARNLGSLKEEFIEIGKGTSGFKFKDHNWHAHVLISTRRVAADGKDFDSHKAVDLMPVVKKGKVVRGPDNGKNWADHQNQYFEEKGYEFRVDQNGIVPQEHLGPYRLRAQAFDLIEEHSRRREENAEKSVDPQAILKKITTRQSLFTKRDIEMFLEKHTPEGSIKEVRDAFWKQPEIVRMYDEDSEVVGFSTQAAVEEERQIMRVSQKVHQKEHVMLSKKQLVKASEGLTPEQQKAFENSTGREGVVCIEGFAGTGKSYLLKAVKGAYEGARYRVRAFGPDSATSKVLAGKGFDTSENVYRFLFALNRGERKIRAGKEVWIIDEAGKTESTPILQLLKFANRHDVKVIFVGDSAQLSSVGRGGIFKALCTEFGSSNLEEIHRQLHDGDKAITKALATGDISSAFTALEERGSIHWCEGKEAAYANLVLAWGQWTEKREGKNDGLVLAGTNKDVHILNEMVRGIRKERGEVGLQEVFFERSAGIMSVSKGDIVEFRKNDKELGVTNGLRGEVLEVSSRHFVVSVSESNQKARIIQFNPMKYKDFQLGYATTFYRSQGRTEAAAFVLHSRQLNKQMAYVGLSRHVEDVQYFVPKNESPNLEHLISLASRDGEKVSSLGLVSDVDLERQTVAEKSNENVASLQESNRLVERLKGNLLASWRSIKETTGEFVEAVQDTRADQSFFKAKLDKDKPTPKNLVTTRQEVRDVLLSDQLKSPELAAQFMKGALHKSCDVKPLDALLDPKKSKEFAGKDVLLWKRGDVSDAIPAISKLLEVGAKRIRLVDPEWIQKTFVSTWRLGEELPEDVKRYALSNQMKGMSFDRLKEVASRQLKLDSNDRFGRQMVADAVSLHLMEHKEEISKMFEGKTLKEKGIELEKIGIRIGSILTEGKEDRANGSFEERVMQWQLSLYRLKSGKEPLASVLNRVQETLKAVEGEGKYSNEAGLCAVHRVINRAGSKASAVDKDNLEHQLNDAVKVIGSQVKREIEIENVSPLQGKGHSHEP